MDWEIKIEGTQQLVVEEQQFITDLENQLGKKFLPFAQVPSADILDTFWLPPAFGSSENITGYGAKGGHIIMLGLYNEVLKEIPPSIGNLLSLGVMWINFAQVETIPPSIGLMENLTLLYMIGNKLKTLPDTIGNLQKLETLDLRANCIQQLPESIANCRI